jgi:hypothetical protein
MVPYGKYLLSIGSPGYIQDRVSFDIDKDIPFYINQVTLIPRASYENIGASDFEGISKIQDASWIGKKDGVTLLYDETFLSGSRITPYGMPIGGGYFLS